MAKNLSGMMKCPDCKKPMKGGKCPECGMKGMARGTPPFGPREPMGGDMGMTPPPMGDSAGPMGLSAFLKKKGKKKKPVGRKR